LLHFLFSLIEERGTLRFELARVVSKAVTL